MINIGHEKVAQAYATAAGVKNEPELGELEHTPDQELDLTAFAHRPSGIIQLSSLLMRDFMEYAEHKVLEQQTEQIFLAWNFRTKKQ